MLDQECIFVYLDLFSFNTLFPVYKSYTIFVMFIPKYFLFSWELFVIGIDFLISISDCSFLVYRNTIDFCVLIYNQYIALQSWWTLTVIVFHGFLKIFLSVRPCHLKTEIIFLAWVPFLFLVGYQPFRLESWPYILIHPYHLFSKYSPITWVLGPQHMNYQEVVEWAQTFSPLEISVIHCDSTYY